MGTDPDGLVLRYQYRDTDGTGELNAEVRCGGFAGASAAWFSNEDLLNFAGRLTTYPLSDSGFGLSGGYGHGTEFEELVGLVARAVDGRGQLGVRTHLATPSRDTTPAGTSRREVHVEVLTTYEALGRFAAELKSLVEGTADEARLDADVLW